MKTDSFLHKTVLLDEAIQGLNVKPDGFYIDATFGRGGHSQKILSLLSEKGKLWAIDCDPDAVKIAKTWKDPRFSIIHGEFSKIKEYAIHENILGKVNGILFDFGVSSPQLDDAMRGFSFMKSGPLDMRMDPTSGISAEKWLQIANENEIANVLKTFGEERFAKRIAREIVAKNKTEEKLTNTLQLAELIKNISPKTEKNKHPATRSFQAIRIFINRELEQISSVLTQSLPVLAEKGRLSIISFHSLEDRLVKQFIRKESEGAKVPAGIPLTQLQIDAIQTRQLKKIATIKPKEEEIYSNPRARSAILRIAEKQ